MALVLGRRNGERTVIVHGGEKLIVTWTNRGLILDGPMSFRCHRDTDTPKEKAEHHARKANHQRTNETRPGFFSADGLWVTDPPASGG